MASSSSFRQRTQEPEIMAESIELKGPVTYTVSDDPDSKDSPENESPVHGDVELWGDTEHDLRDMKRLGKKQEFQRNFTFWSALGFVSVYMATWEFVLVSLSVGFANGGFAGLFWCFLTTVLCYSSIVASLAEMASMAPTSGGQYHWVSEFAPPRYQRILSYASGWTSTLGWLASVAGSNFVLTTQIEAMVEIMRPSFAFENWQYVLLMVAFVAITILFNTWGAKALPALETTSLVGHLVGFFIVLIPLWVLCPKNDASDVFSSFEWQGGWTPGPGYLVSQVTVMYCNLGSDSVVHISEEVEDASITIDSNVPYLLLFNNTGSTALSVILNVILFVLIYAGNITALATCAREMWAFARDRGLPFSSWIGKMNTHWNIPFHSVYATSAACILLSFINFGSTLAFNIVVSVSLLGLLSTYMISIGCVLLKRIRGEPLPPARWSLGRFGILVNTFGFVYSGVIIVFSCFPSYLPVDAASANYGPLIWVAVMIIAVAVYVVHGKRHYTAPVQFVEGRKAAGVGFQSS
ncbi:GABA permease-like protein [Hortaea werneckii]|nr:GABA permease-like protein [Hortaea werneckii]KAI7005752.1 GABA permease-like protein [Hortaea werneckii]